MEEVNYEAMNDPETFVTEYMREGFRLWIENAIPPGSFGMAVLSNDLKEACGRADTTNRRYIFSIVSWLYNYAPSDCWGSKENTETWRRASFRSRLTHETKGD